MPEIASYYARIWAKDDEFRNALLQSESRFKNFVGGMAGIGVGIGTAFAAIGTGVRAVEGVAGFFSGAIMSAADLEESMSKIESIFHGSAGSVIDFAQTLSDQFGIVRAVSLDAAANFGAILKASGFDEQDAAAISMKMVKLAADMSSNMNMPIELAAEKLRAGLVGEAEPLRAVGVLLSETAVKAEAAASGIGGMGRELTEGEKVTARYNIIMRQTKDMQGDLERTADSTKNSFRKMSGQWTEFQTDLGRALSPGVSAVMPTLTSLSTALGEFLKGHADEIKELAKAFGEDLVGALKNVAWFLGTVAHGMQTTKDIVNEMGGAVGLRLPGSTDIGPTDFHPELRSGRKKTGVFDTETFKSDYEASKTWLADQIRMQNAQKAADEGLAGSAIWGGLQSGLGALWRGGQIANELFQTARPVEKFQSSMIATSGIAADVTQAALSRDDTTKKLAERQAKAGEKALEYLRPMAESIKDALIPKFA